jgi:hypothetical protein
MVSGFEDSVYKILRVIALNEAFYDPDPTVGKYRAVMETLGEERFHLALGGGNTLSRFLDGIEFEGFTKTDERKRQFYLTEKGVDKLEELSEIMQEDYQRDLRVA